MHKIYLWEYNDYLNCDAALCRSLYVFMWLMSLFKIIIALCRTIRFSSLNVKCESGNATNSTKSLEADKKGRVEKHLHACEGDTTTACVHCSDSATYSTNAKPSAQSIIF